jgi:hypothetical protein
MTKYEAPICVVIVAIILTIGGCNLATRNVRTKNWGGTMTVQIVKGQKLVNVNWKDNQLWYLTRPMQSDDVAETYTFKEKSTLGALEGKVIFNETK